ncbi:MAG TPA: hypothetical protein VFJ05_05625 [Nitrososphaeraceae archaeon]|nr:hypothetical protein [Nitrososphaeraceae archaeon]
MSSSSEAVDSNNDASLGEEEEDVSVSIITQAMNVQFKGPLQSVLKSTVDFFIKQFPEVDLTRKISLYYDKDYLIEKYSSLIKISPEGVQVLAQPDTSSSTVEDIIQEETPNESDLKDDKIVAAAAAAESSKTKHEAKWSIKEFVALQLVASRIAKGLGIVQDEGMKISDIESATKANPKSVTPRLSEMIRSGHVTKDLRFGTESVEEPSTIYRITTAGIHWLNNIIDKKVKRL